jgi:hypothetical protein
MLTVEWWEPKPERPVARPVIVRVMLSCSPSNAWGRKNEAIVLVQTIAAIAASRVVTNDECPKGSSHEQRS